MFLFNRSLGLNFLYFLLIINYIRFAKESIDLNIRSFYISIRYLYHIIDFLIE